MPDLQTLDPRGLIKDSYAIDGISEPECRSIFLDWAIAVPVGQDARPQIRALLDHYAEHAPDHPMTRVLGQGLADAPVAQRRGGRKARVSG
ncbi:MAG: hypothetical protein HRU32_04275 [Rhodobacteraceae bacterium]|nr:hypothetical protein [Paracoccaceae bacterium]